MSKPYFCTERKVRYALVAVSVILLLLWMHSRWDVWFAMPDEPPYVASAKPYRVMLTFGDGTELTRNVSWQCGDSVETAFVELERHSHVDGGCCDGEQADTAWTTPVRIAASGEVFESRSGRAAYYVARLRQLDWDACYRYRVCTGGRYSSWHTFVMPSHARAHVSFIYIGDVQDTIRGAANGLLREAFRRHPDAECLVCGGDMTERPSDNYWAETFRALDGIRQSMPVLCATGNHDYLKGIPLRLERRFSLVFSYFLDSMVGENQVFAQRLGDVELFVLDSNREANYLLAQRRWLDERLAQSTARWKILVVHHPLFSIKGSTQNIVERWMFNDVVEAGGVDLVLQGHEHAYARMTRHVDGVATTPVYTVSHCSPKNYRIEFDERFDKFGISSRYYQTVRICGDTLQLAAYEVYGHTLYDSLAIIKHAGERPTIVDEGRSIPEYMEYTPDPQKKKEVEFARRISEYCKRHPERLAR